MAPRILVLGKSGQLASEFRFLSKSHAGFQFVGKEQLKPHDQQATSSLIDSSEADFVVNCTAYTAVDRAETERDQCSLLNRDFPQTLALACKRQNRHLIHFSTDYVFNGNSGDPITEDEPTDPINFYGLSKRDGETRVLESGASATIIRTSWVYSRYGANFVKTMLRLASQMPELRVVADQVGCPTHAQDIAKIVMNHFLVKTGTCDLYHYSGGGQTSWAGFAEEILRIWNIGTPVRAITTADFPTPAVRPKYSVLSKEKLKREKQVSIPEWKTSLKECFDVWSHQ